MVQQKCMKLARLATEEAHSLQVPTNQLAAAAADKYSTRNTALPSGHKEHVVVTDAQIATCPLL